MIHREKISPSNVVAFSQSTACPLDFRERCSATSWNTETGRGSNGCRRILESLDYTKAMSQWLHGQHLDLTLPLPACYIMLTRYFDRVECGNSGADAK